MNVIGDEEKKKEILLWGGNLKDWTLVLTAKHRIFLHGISWNDKVDLVENIRND